MGYVVGEDGEAYKVSAEGNIQEPTIGGTLNSSAFLWEKFDLLDPFGIYLNGISDIKTVAFADRYRGFFGGINPGPDYLYSILVNDESEYFSGKFWYDKVGRMILSQNTRQFNKTPKSYIYTMYDALGRVIESGEKTENSVAGEPNFASIFGSEINGYINQQTIDNTKFNNWIVASGIRTEVIQTYYDFQEFTSLGITQDHLQNRIASSTYEDLFDNINNTYNYATHYSYDIHGNTKVLWQENRELPSAISNQELKRIDYNFDLISGKVNQVSYQPGEVDAFYHKYEYDADNRLVRTETSTDDIFYDTDARYYYYPHGALARVEYGDINVQGMDYAYTLQGRIKGVNSNLLKPNLDIGRDGYIPTSALEAANPNQNFAYDAMGFTLGYRIKDYFPIDDDISIFNVWNDDKRFEANWYFQNNSAIGSDLLDNRHNLYNGNISSMVTTLPDELTITNSTTLSDITVGINGYSYKYDQLNRLMDAVAFENVETNSTAIGYNSWKNEANPTLKYGNSFEYDANGNILTQVRNDASNNTFDNLSYKYLETAGNRLQNRLYHVEETEPDNDMPDDIDHIDAFEPDPNLINSDNIFSYDELGNLVKDEGSKIASISWTVSGKIRNIVRESGSTLPDLEFRYDASGNRIMKIVKPAGSGNDPNQWITTHYVHDAAGHIMVTYEETTPSNATEYILKERTIYGSSRVGIYTREVDMIAATMSDEGSRDLGKKCLELTNHLSNVLAVVSDKKIPIQDGSTGDIDYFLADIVSVSDYYPFGAPLVGRAHDTENYRFGFNGKENDNEVKYDVNDDPIIGAQQEYGMRIYDNRIARFLSVDPLTASYPFKTPYDFAENGPIQYLDLDGLEKLDFETHWAMGAASGNAGIGLVTYAFDWLTSGIVDMSEGMIQKAENYAIHNTENAYTINVPENVRSTREKVIDQEATAKAYGGMLDWYSKCQTIMGGAMGPLEGGQLAITTRQTIAASYYAKAGFKAADAASHMTGIDFTKNVERVILKKGTIIQQWVRKEGTGDYFTTIENGSKQNLGIGYEGRQLQQFVVEQDVEVLKSTASEVDGAVGGGVQY
ncbi:MAG: RHS repeat-associated core domain-containing protein, partial [Chitinophagales bacterium]